MLMMTRRRLVIAAAIVIAVVLGAVIRNQVKVYHGRQARAALMRERHPVETEPAAVVAQRQALFDLLQPIALANCEMDRFGEANDGGYLMCGNLLAGARSGYSYGISGYDDWGCQVSKAIDAPVHQYDCFDTTRPTCLFGDTVFHEECVGATTETIDGRRFDTVDNQFVGNGDGAKRIVMKIDVEGAEWDTLLAIPDATLGRIDQLAVEFHWSEDDNFNWIHDDKHQRVVRRLKQFFEIAHLHFNNASCVDDLLPFPSFAYEVLFVSKRLAVADPDGKAGGPHPLDAPNNAWRPDCQPAQR